MKGKPHKAWKLEGKDIIFPNLL